MPRPHPRFVTSEGKIARGVRRLQSIPNAAGPAEWAVKVPGGRMWRVLGASAVLGTGATVGNRVPGVQILSQATQLYVNSNTLNVAASSTTSLTYQLGSTLSPGAGVAGVLPIPIPLLWLEPGDSFGSLTSGLVAGDVYSAITLLVEELWFDNQDLNDEELEHEHLIHELLSGGVK